MGDESEVENESKMDVTNASDQETNAVSLTATENTQPKPDAEAIKKKATLLFLQGKRSIYIRDYQAALVALSECCQLFSQIYPEMDESLADPYFYYGKALLEVGRNESDVLGDQVQDDDDDEVDEDEDDDEEEGEENKESHEEGGEQGKETEENKELKRNGDSVSKNTPDSTEEKSHEDGKESKTTSDEENGEVNDLQLSWEYLELAKLIYSKKSDTCKATAIKLAETYACLGENGLESENYSMAIEDIKQALKLQKMHLKEEDRRIAETYYQLGVAYSLDQNYDEAIESFKSAIEQLEKKISSLEMRKKIGDKKTEEEEKDAFYTMDGEINEIKTVIKDIEEKIRDMKESKDKVKAELLKQVYGCAQPSESSAQDNAASSSVPATDISHLIKRKRKNEDSAVSEEKKLKTEN